MGDDTAVAATCEDVVQVYPSASGAVAAVRGITAQFPKSSVTIVMGPSGAGKSTLLRLLACLERPAAGDIRIAGTRTAHLSGRRRRRLIGRYIGYVFQRPGHNLLEYLTVAEHVDLAWRMRAVPSAGTVSGLIDTAGLTVVRDVRPEDLSAGEQQRLAFTMAVAGGPALVVADEPTAELDPAGARALVELLPTLSRAGQTFVIASHDLAVAATADQLLVVRGGMLAARATGGGDLLPVIDDAGAISLPDDVLAAFPERRARIDAEGDSFRLTRP